MTQWGSVDTTLCSMGHSWGQWGSVEISGGQLRVSGSHWGSVRVIGRQWGSLGVSQGGPWGSLEVIGVYWGGQWGSVRNLYTPPKNDHFNNCKHGMQADPHNYLLKKVNFTVKNEILSYQRKYYFLF